MRVFEPMKIGKMELENRLVMAPGVTHFGTPEGYVTERLIDYYVRRAEGGAGLIQIEGSWIELMGAFFPGLIISRDDLEGLSRLARKVKAAGAKVSLQMTDGGILAREGWNGGAPAVCPTPMATWRGQAPPKALTIAEIERKIQVYGKAAMVIREAGFDSINYHVGHGMLPTQFLSPLLNKRTDEYGGETIRKRARFMLEVIRHMREKVGKDLPIIMRVSGTEGLEAGLTVEHAKEYCKLAEEAGVDCIDVNAGRIDLSPEWVVPPYLQPRGLNVPFAGKIRGAVDIPVIVSGGIRDLRQAEAILEEEKADLIGMCRPFFADPDLAKKALQGRADEIRPCITCGKCIDKAIGEPVTCTVNPEMGYEGTVDIKKTTSRKKVMIIGAGPGGMETARVLALREHDVTLYEKADRLGGQLILAAIPPAKDELKQLIRYYAKQLDILPVKVELNREVTPQLVEEEGPDAVVVATGASAMVPDIPGIHARNVVAAEEVLLDRAAVGQKVVVMGGAMVGCETAHLLAEKGKSVTIVEMLEMIGAGLGPARAMLLRRLDELGVERLPGAKGEEITGDGLVITRDGKSELLKADTIVLAVGYQPDRALYQGLMGKVFELYLIGDSRLPRDILGAIHEGYKVGLKI